MNFQKMQKFDMNFIFMTLEHKTVVSSTGIFGVIDNNTLYGSKLYICISCQKSCQMFHEDITYCKYIKT